MRCRLHNAGLFLLLVLMTECNTKQKLNAPLQDSVRIDSTYPYAKEETKQEIHQEARFYDSSSKHVFNFKNLSRQFDIKLDVQRFIERDDVHDSCIVKAYLMDKLSRQMLDSLSITSLFFYSNYFTDPRNCASYSTGVHVFKPLVDNYAGDLVVADLNFDGKDDMAMINDMGGNSGPSYSYFIQQAGKKFVLDYYLTDSVSFFPSSFNRKKKTMTILAHAGACCVGKHVYHYDVKEQEWRQVEHVILGLKKTHPKQ